MTKQEPQKRWGKNGKRYKINNSLFGNAITKYGWDSFEHVIIANKITFEEAENFEILLVKKLKSNEKELGYNITAGGKGCKKLKHSDKTISKMKKSHKGIINYELRNKVVCLTTGEIFDSITEASLIHKNDKVHKSSIIKCCKGKQNYSGFSNKLNQFLVWQYYSDFEKGLYKEIFPPKPRKEINKKSDKKCICLTTGDIFKSPSEASKVYKINNKKIASCCRGVISYCGEINKEKLRWQYYCDYINSNKKEPKIKTRCKKVVCLNNGSVFNSVKEAGLFYGKEESSSISACCKNKKLSAYKHPETGEKLMWAYL